MSIETVIAVVLLAAVFGPLSVHLFRTRGLDESAMREFRTAQKALRR